MVESSSDASQAEVLAYAHAIIAEESKIPKVAEDNACERVCHFEMRGSDPTLVHHLTADITMDSVKAFFADFPTNMDKITPDNASFKVIGEVNGRKIAHHKMKPGVPLVSDRSMIVTYYTIEGEGEFTWMASGKNIDAASYKEHVGKDVIGTVNCSYFHFKQTDAGMRCTHVSSSSPNGSIPNMVIAKLGKVQQEQLCKVVEACKWIKCLALKRGKGYVNCTK